MTQLQRMRLSGTVIEIWPFEILPGILFQKQRSIDGRWIANITLISHTSLCYVRNVTREE